MGKIIKIVILLVYCIWTYASCLWGVSLIIAVLSLTAYAFRDDLNTIILLPVFFAIVSFVCMDYGSFSIALLLLYLSRLFGERPQSFSAPQLLFSIFVSLSCIIFSFEHSVVPLVLLVYSLPTPHISSSFVKLKTLPLLIGTVSFGLVILLSLFFLKNDNEPRRAYYQNGVWAQATVPYSLDNLTNTSSYSYSELVALLEADIISSFDGINNYDELWIVTPTTPFSRDELSVIKEWVRRGGHLILVSDHTDLYGHARCANQVANLFGVSIHNSATFDKRNKQEFHDLFGKYQVIKTGTSINGLCFPIMSAWLWEEVAYYANENFFGPLSPSGDDHYRNHVLHGYKQFWRGGVSFFQDSTIFANFAVYQPGTLRTILNISNTPITAKYAFIIPFIFLASLCLIVLCKQKWISLSPLSLLLIFSSNQPTLNLGDNPQIWTGNRSFVNETFCPYSCVSTCFSLSPLSNRKPLWRDFVPLSEQDVIWVDSIPPPNSNWRWVQIEHKHITRNTSISPWETLYSLLEAPYIEQWSTSKGYCQLKTTGLFTDTVMNNWWYNDGISIRRQQRIKAWINWLNKESLSPPILNSCDSIFTKQLFVTSVKVGDNSFQLELPKPIAQDGVFIYLGSGISGVVTHTNGSLAIFGKSQYSENINCPEVWAVVFEE